MNFDSEGFMLEFQLCHFTLLYKVRKNVLTYLNFLIILVRKVGEQMRNTQKTVEKHEDGED